MPSNEVEIKFILSDLAATERRLRAIGFRRITPRTHEMNVLYDLPGNPLRRRGEILRLREYGGKWKLTHKSKGTAKRHKSRVELETAVDDGKKLDAILHALGFRPTFRYEKFRSEWSDGRGHVVLDHTPIADLGEIEGDPEWIDETARKLGIERGDYITKSYAELFFEWKRRTGQKAMNMTFEEIGGSAKPDDGKAQ